MSQLNHLNHRGYNQLKKLLDVQSSKTLIEATYVTMTAEERESFRGTITVLREEKKKAQEQLNTLDATVKQVREIEKFLNTVVLPINDSQDGYDTSSPRSEVSEPAVVKQSLLSKVVTAVVGGGKSKSSSSSSSSSSKKRRTGSTLFEFVIRSTLSFDNATLLHFLNRREIKRRKDFRLSRSY